MGRWDITDTNSMKKIGLLIVTMAVTMSMYAVSVGDECTYSGDGSKGRVGTYSEESKGSSWSGGGGLNSGLQLNASYNSGQTNTTNSGYDCVTETGRHRTGW